MPRNIVGAEVRKLRDQRNWSQEEFAGRLQRAGWDISRGTLAKIEAQIRCVNDEELLALGRTLEVSLEELYPLPQRAKPKRRASKAAR